MTFILYKKTNKTADILVFTYKYNCLEYTKRFTFSQYLEKKVFLGKIDEKKMNLRQNQFVYN